MAKRWADLYMAHLYKEHGLPSVSAENVKRWQESGCEGKSAFSTKEKADKYADKYREKYGSNQQPYSCPFCGKWHLSTKKTINGINTVRGRD